MICLQNFSLFVIKLSEDIAYGPFLRFSGAFLSFKSLPVPVLIHFHDIIKSGRNSPFEERNSNGIVQHEG